MLLSINAVLAIVIGLVLTLAPQDALRSMGFMAGAVIFVSGLFLVMGTFIYSQGQKTHPMWLLEGVINIALGAILMLKPTWLFEFIIMLAGIWAFVVGVLQLYVVVGGQHSRIRYRAWLLSSAVLSLLIGGVLLLKPALVAELMIQILGGVSLLVGLSMAAFALQLRRLWKKAKKDLEIQEAQVIETAQEETTEAPNDANAPLKESRPGEDKAYRQGE